MVALRTVRYNERHDIFTAFTRERGRMAFAVSAGSGRGAVRMRAMLMPLSVVECEATVRPGRDVHVMGGVRAMLSVQDIHSRPVKGAVAMFLAEVLDGVVRDGPADAALWEYVAGSVGVLEGLRGVGLADFHIYFLGGLLRALGVAPDGVGMGGGCVLDVTGGVFRRTAPVHSQWIGGERAELMRCVLGSGYESVGTMGLSGVQRRQLLDDMLRYLGVHYVPMGGLRSLDVLRDVLGG